jgi:hypothetical protein
MGKGKQQVQMQRRNFAPKHPIIQGLQSTAPQRPSYNMAELERQHVAWLQRRGYSYISLEETARLWRRSPEQIIRWEELLDERGYYPE